MKRIASGIVACALGTWLVAAAGLGAQPKPKVILQGDRKVIYYPIGANEYREVQPAELGRSPAATKVCVQAKLARLQGSEFQLHGTAFAEVQIVAAPTLNATANPGANLLLGGMVRQQDGQAVFQVEAFVELDDDFALFRARLAELERDKTTAPEEYFRLAWWITECEKLAMGLSPEAFEEYRNCMRRAAMRGLEMESALLAGDPAENSLAATVKRLRGLVAAAAGALLQGHADWHVTAARKLLHAHADAAKALESGQPLDPAARKRLTAGMHLMLGQMYTRYLEDASAAAAAYRRGAELCPEDPDLGREMRALGYELTAGQWLTGTEARALAEQQRLDAERAARQAAQEAASQAQGQQRRLLVAGEGMEKTISIVESCLSQPSEANVKELAGAFKTLPEDAVRHALWCAARLSQKSLVTPLAEAGLASEAERVRMDAVDLLVSTGVLAGAERVILHLRDEPADGVSRHAVAAIQRLPGKDGIEGMIMVLESSAVPEATRKLAGQRLGLETGQTFGLDSFSWRQWWKKNRAAFTRAGE